jgi:hypothetical protein
MGKKKSTKKTAPQATKKTAPAKDPLVLLATEMNEVMGFEEDESLDPDADNLEDEIKALLDQVYPEDQEVFSAESWEKLKELGCPAANADTEDETMPDGPDATAISDESDSDEDTSDTGDDDEDTGDDDEEDLQAQVASTRKLDGLKALVESYMEFKKLRKALDQYTGLDGARNLKAEMQEIVGKPEKPTPTKRGSSRGQGKPGVIKTIQEMVEKAPKKGVSKEEILDHLTNTFPDREPKSMKRTINVQVPGRINKEAFPVEVLSEEGQPTRYRKQA